MVTVRAGGDDEKRGGGEGEADLDVQVPAGGEPERQADGGQPEGDGEQAERAGFGLCGPFRRVEHVLGAVFLR